MAVDIGHYEALGRDVRQLGQGEAELPHVTILGTSHFILSGRLGGIQVD